MATMDPIFKYSREFNTHCKKVGRIFVAKRKGEMDEADVYRSQKRMHILIAEKPLFLIYELGPHLIKYGELIQKKDWDNFVTTTEFDEKVDEEIKAAGVGEHTNAIKEYMTIIKQTISDSSKKEKEIIGDTLENMLSLFCQYAMHIQDHGLEEQVVALIG
jgi:hypothetical protein